MCETPAAPRALRAHNPDVARSARRSPSLEVGAEVTALLRPEEATRLHDLRALERVQCAVCGAWIEPSSGALTSVRAAQDGDGVAVEFTHAVCAPSGADLAKLVVLAQAEPLGIRYAQAVHAEAGPVLLWERRLDLRVRGIDGHEQYLYLDPDWWEGFHPALADEPVRLLVGWLLQSEGEDLVLHRGGVEIERFHGALRGPPAGWHQGLEESGFCLLIVGAGLGLELPGAPAIQRAIRERRALMGLAEYEV
jgi:hypothetical protein